jgi:hypothetical protein
MNAIPKMDKFYRKCIFLGEVAKVGVGCLDQVPLRTWWGSTRLPRALKPMVPRKIKLGGISPQRA